MTYIGTDIQDIRENVLALYEGDSEIDNSRSTVYPDLQFTCSGNITSIWFIASGRDPPVVGDADYLEFQLWRNNRLARIQIVSVLIDGDLSERISPPSSGAGLHVNSNYDDLSLYQFVLEEPVQFERGDILGISQTSQSPLELWTLSGGGVRNYRWLLLFQRLFARAYTPNVAGLNREPMVAIEGEFHHAMCSCMTPHN